MDRVCIAGDSNGDGEFDEQDIVSVLRAGKYLTGNAASFAEGDWNRDGVFNQLDVVKALDAGTYLAGPLVSDRTEVIQKETPLRFGFSPPLIISAADELNGIIPSLDVRETLANTTDFETTDLLYFSWSGSGGDRIRATASVRDSQTELRFDFDHGLTLDLRGHLALFAVPKDAQWKIVVDGGGLVGEDSVQYRLDEGSTLLVTGGLAGVNDEYEIEGEFELVWRADGTASLGTDAVLRGDGISGLDGTTLQSILNLDQLLGLQLGSRSVAFTGRDQSGFSTISLRAFISGKELSLQGENRTPCCDFFQYSITAAGSVVNEL